MEFLKKRGWIFAIVIILWLVVYNFPWRYEIDTTLQGIQCRIGDEDYSEDVSIMVKGVYKNYLIKDDTFEGSISIDTYDFTLDVPIRPTRFYGGIASLRYQNVRSFRARSLGFFLCTPDFDKLLIGIDEPIEETSKGWNGGNGLIICAPAKNREQALEIAKILSSKSNWLSHSNWSE